MKRGSEGNISWVELQETTKYLEVPRASPQKKAFPCSKLEEEWVEEGVVFSHQKLVRAVCGRAIAPQELWPSIKGHSCC